MTGHEVRIFFSYEKLGGGYWGNFWVIGKSFFFGPSKSASYFWEGSAKGVEDFSELDVSIGFFCAKHWILISR